MSRLPYIQYGGKQLRELEKDMKSMNLGVIFSEGTKRAMRYDLVFVCSTCDVHVLIGTCRLVGAKSTPSMNSNIHPDLSGPASQVLITVYASYTVH